MHAVYPDLMCWNIWCAMSLNIIACKATVLCITHFMDTVTPTKQKEWFSFLLLRMDSSHTWNVCYEEMLRKLNQNKKIFTPLRSLLSKKRIICLRPRWNLNQDFLVHTWYPCMPITSKLKYKLLVWKVSDKSNNQQELVALLYRS